MKTYILKLCFTAPIRGTRPAADIEERHIAAIRGRLLEIAKKELGTKNEDKVEKEVEEWIKGNMSVFPRKQFNGTTQISIPSAWIFGFLETQIRARQLRKLSTEAIQQFYKIRPVYIGLLKPENNKARPVTDDDVVIEKTGIISRDSAKKRSAIRRFETVYPIVLTEKIYIHSNSPMSASEEEDLLRTLFEFGRMGATRGQGYGEFKLHRLEQEK